MADAIYAINFNNIINPQLSQIIGSASCIKRKQRYPIIIEVYGLAFGEYGTREQFMQIIVHKWNAINLNLLFILEMKTLIIHGTKDKIVSYAQSKSLSENISGSILHTIEGGGHGLYSTHTEEVTGVLNNFMNRVTAAPN